MGLMTYAMLLFGISLALFFIGQPPALFTLLQCPTTSATCNPNADFITNFLNTLFTSIAQNPYILGIAGVGAVATFLMGGSFAVIYLIPILILYTLANYLILPTDFLIASGLPFEIQIVVIGFMNFLLLMTCVGFIRGGE